MYKCLQNLSPEYLSSQFEFVHNSHTHVTRNHSSNTLIVPKFRSNSGMRTFHVRAAYAWNSLPPEIRLDMESMSINQFKVRAYKV